MKSKRQAQIWKNKITYFNDGTVREINLIDLNDSTRTYEIKRTWAIVKGVIAIHLPMGETKPTSFVVTHLLSGIWMAHIYDTDLSKFDFETMDSKAIEVWENNADDMRKQYNIPLNGHNPYHTVIGKMKHQTTYWYIDTFATMPDALHYKAMNPSHDESSIFYDMTVIIHAHPINNYTHVKRCDDNVGTHSVISFEDGTYHNVDYKGVNTFLH